MHVTIWHDTNDRVFPHIADHSIDVIFIDPPYNTGNATDKTPTYSISESLVRQNWSAFHADWDVIDDYVAFARQWLAESRRVLKPDGSIWICASFHNLAQTMMALFAEGYYIIQDVIWHLPDAFPNRKMEKMVSGHQTLLWARPNARIKHQYNPVYAKSVNAGKNLKDVWNTATILDSAEYATYCAEVFAERFDDVWVMAKGCASGNKLKHPSKKPVRLVERALRLSFLDPETVTVLDFFAGSGTTAEAASNIGCRETILIEQEGAYIDEILKRLGPLPVSITQRSSTTLGSTAGPADHLSYRPTDPSESGS